MQYWNCKVTKEKLFNIDIKNSPQKRYEIEIPYITLQEARNLLFLLNLRLEHHTLADLTARHSQLFI